MLNPKNTLDIKITNPKDNGKKIFQPNLISWSYLYLGKVVRTHTKENKKNNNFILIQKIDGIKFNKYKSKKGNQPPKNKITVR